jgi:aminoglycoside 6'-N-acetyltransferase I
MRNDIEIRPATDADRAELYRLIRALFPDLQPHELDPEVDEYLAPDRGQKIVFVAQRNLPNRLAGFIEVGTRPYAEGCATSPVPYVEAWYVDEDVRRQSVGRALFGAAEAWSRAEGFTEIASDVQIDNAGSIAAHKALGYEETERLVCFRRSL